MRRPAFPANFNHGQLLGMLGTLALGSIGLLLLSMRPDPHASSAGLSGEGIAATITLLALSGVLGWYLYRRSRRIAERTMALHAEATRQRARFESLVQSTDGIVWESDTERQQFAFVSDKAAAILGYAPGEWLQPGFWLAHLHPHDRRRIPLCSPGQFGQPRRRELEYRMIASDGRIIWIHDLISLVVEEDGSRQLRGLMLDVTARKQVEADTLRMLSEQKALLDNVLVGIAFVRNRQIVSCNRRFEELFGYEAGALTGQSTRLLYASRRSYEEIGRAAYSGEPRALLYSSEVLMRRRGGRAFWCALSAQALDPAHPDDGSIWLYTDISDRKAAEDEAKQLRRAVEQSPVSILITDPDGVIEYVNPRFSEVSGFSRREVVGQTPRILRSGETPDDIYRDLWATVLAGREWRGRMRNRRKNGELFWEEASIAPVFGEDGTVAHFIAVKEDITERQRKDDELARYRESLESQVLARTEDLALAMQKARAAERAKDEFLTHMSHEIRTPINAIVGFSELLADTALDARQRDYLAKLNGAGEHLLTLINKVLDLSKIAAGKLELTEHEFALADTLDRLSSVLGLQAQEKRLVMTVEAAPGLPERLRGDALRLNQILMNLLANAIKFTDCGAVSLHAELATPPGLPANRVDIRFTVRDTGIGMAQDELERVFEPFAQADASMTRRYGGTGLGLSISRELVTLMGGQLDVRSARGEGSEFIVTLPFRVAATKGAGSGSPRDATQRPCALHFADVHVLLAEDQPLNQQVAIELLAKAGIATTIANNGREALDLLDGTTHFDLVLMDLQMPVLDGLSAIREIRRQKQFEALPVIAMTAHVLDEERRECLAAGANDHLGKPFRPDALLARLADWLPAAKVIRGAPLPTPAEAAPAERPPVIDARAGIERFAGREDKYRNWLERFRSDWQDGAARLRRHAAAADHDAFARETHALKGLAGSLGLMQLNATCAAVEAVRRQDVDIESLEQALQRVEQALDLTFGEVSAYLQEGEAS